MRSEGNFFMPAGCLLRTNNSIPGSPDGIMTSLLSSFGLAACANGLMRTVLAVRHASVSCHESARNEIAGIVKLPFLLTAEARLRPLWPAEELRDLRGFIERNC